MRPMGTQVCLVEAAGRKRSYPLGEPEGRAVCVFLVGGPSNHQGRRGEGADLGVKCKGGGNSLWGVTVQMGVRNGRR